MWEWVNRLFKAGNAAPGQAPCSEGVVEAQPPSALKTPTSAGAPSHPAQLALLAKFRFPSDPAEVGKEYWNAVLPEPIGSTLAEFRRNGWLVDAPWQDVFDASHRVDELKPLLRERGLKVSGKKAELVARLIDADAEGMQGRVADVDSWVLSPAVAGTVEEHLAADAAARDQARATAFTALRNGRAREAVDAIAGYESTRVFARGLGYNWHSPGTAEHTVVNAQAILDANPKLLRDVPEHELALLRPVAAMLELTGESRAAQWLPAGVAGHPRLGIETAVRMLLFHGKNAVRLREMSEAGDKQVVVMGCASSSCATCRAMDGKKFAIDRTPELPHPDCTHEMGCRCLYEHHFDA